METCRICGSPIERHNIGAFVDATTGEHTRWGVLLAPITGVTCGIAAQDDLLDVRERREMTRFEAIYLPAILGRRIAWRMA